MGSRPNGLAAAAAATGASPVTQLKENWCLARDAHNDLQLARPRRTNLLLVGSPVATRLVLEMLDLGVREPVLTWRPGQALELPPAGRAATLVLHDVDRLSAPEQHFVLGWLEQPTGTIWIVSTTAESLWPLVQRGAFSEVLYYRLNTVCLTAAAEMER